MLETQVAAQGRDPRSTEPLFRSPAASQVHFSLNLHLHCRQNAAC